MSTLTAPKTSPRHRRTTNHNPNAATEATHRVRRAHWTEQFDGMTGTVIGFEIWDNTTGALVERVESHEWATTAEEVDTLRTAGWEPIGHGYLVRGTENPAPAPAHKPGSN